MKLNCVEQIKHGDWIAIIGCFFIYSPCSSHRKPVHFKNLITALIIFAAFTFTDLDFMYYLHIGNITVIIQRLTKIFTKCWETKIILIVSSQLLGCWRFMTHRHIPNHQILFQKEVQGMSTTISFSIYIYCVYI